MTDHDNGRSPALQAASAKRVNLKQALSLVEVAAAAPTARPSWRSELLLKLEELRLSLVEHVREVEAPDGLLAEMTAHAPRLANQIGHVRDEHPELCDQINQTIVKTKNSGDVAEVRATVLETLTAIARHRQRGSDLVFEAYNVDIGGS